MELKLFLSSIAVLMFIILLIASFKGEESKWTNSPIAYFGMLVVAILLSYLTFVRYAKSDGKGNYYKNTDYYLFQEEGFRFPKGGVAKLGCNEADSAILISGAGNLTLDDSLCLSSEQFELPLYVGTAGEKSTVNMKVVNLIKDYGMGNGDSLTIEKIGKDGSYSSRILSIKYIEFPHERKFVENFKRFFKKSIEIPDYDSVMFVFSANGFPNDTVIKNSFHKGYNLADLLQEGQSTRFNENALSLYSSCYLVRDHYTLDAPKVKKSDKVYLFADNSVFNDSCRVIVNGTAINSRVDNRVINLKINNGYFCYGIGGATSRVYQVVDEDNAILVKYRLPLKYNLPNDTIGETRLFLTTSKQDIVELSGDYSAASFDAEKDYIFYQFNEQLSDSSMYRASAVLNFRVDKAGVSMKPFYSNSYGKNAQISNEIIPDQSFEVGTLSCEQDTDLAKVSYVFNIIDMRKNEVYNGAKWMYILMLALLLVIYLILHYSPKQNADFMNKWYGIETSIYLVLVAFLTVRLVLLWRLHTFPPIEDVSYKEFGILTDASYYKWTGGSIFAILGLRVLVLLYQWIKYSISLPKWMDFRLSERVSSTIENASQSFWKRLMLYFIPAVIYLFCGFILGQSKNAEVFIKEAVAPIIVFVINSIYYAHKVRVESNGAEDDPDVKKTKRFCWAAILINSISFLVFLCMPKSWVVGLGEQGMFAPMAAMLALWICIAVFLSEEEIRKWIYLPIAVGGFVIVFLHAGIIEKHEWGKTLVEKFPKSRITARIETLVYSPTEMMQRDGVEFGGKTLQDILNASSNKWFIDNHLIQRKKLDKRDGAFLLDKEYNQLAVSYTTQTRDVVLLRYIIYEHGKGVVVLLLVVLALMTVTVFLLYKRNGDDLPLLQMVPSQSALFLFVFASFLYLVNLNAVVFVGLDFPFLSMASRVVPFGLLLPLLAILLPLNIENTDQVLEESLLSDDASDRQKIKVVAVSSLAVGLLVSIPGIDANHKLNQRKKEGRLYAETFSVSMEPLAVFINNYMNPEFKTRQQKDKKYESFKHISIYADDLKTKLDSALIVDGLLEQQLNEYVKENVNRDASRDAAFIRSAFDRFLKTTLTDTKSIIHIRKTKGYFVFVPNKKYYDMKPMFNNGEKTEWRGNLLAAATFRSLQFKDERPSALNKNLFWSMDTVSHLEFLDSESKYKEFLTGNDGTLSCNLYQIPAKYCYKSEDDVFVLMVNVQNMQNKQNRHLIKVYPQRDYSPDNTVKSSLGLRFFANDIVEPDGIDSRFSLRLDDDHYLSKRIHYNGKYQVIYPLKNSFMFAYNFDQMLAESYRPDASLSEQPVRISLDYDLFDSVYKYCDSVVKADKGYGDGIAVTAVDGNGRIRLLADYNPNRILTTDPNQEKELRKKMEEIYLNGDNETERTLLQNRNVAYMSMGPGSTIKVPFYVALMSETQAIRWDTLCVQFPGGIYSKVYNEKTEKYRDMVAQFGKDVVGGIHSLDGWDEMEYEYSNPAFFGSLGPSDFIATSNNFYFGALLMLGAYDAQELNKGLGTVLEDSKQEVSEFPKFMLDGKYYAFKRKLMEDIQDDQHKSRSSHALEAGLSNRFRFNTSHGKSLLHYYDREPVKRLFDATIDSEWANMNGLYVHSTRPSLSRDIGGQTDQETFYDNHFQLTSGSPLQMEVTPLNMAEMYLRMALMNWSEENLLTYDDAAKGVPQTKESFDAGFAQLMQKTAFKGMYKVIEQTTSRLRGTLSKHEIYGDRVGDPLKRELERKGIFLYGKTGTAGGDGQINNNHHYAFILTNKPLHKDNADREGLKVYVVYFGYYNDTKGHYGTRPSRDEILRKIINSDTFKNYWNSNESQN